MSQETLLQWENKTLTPHEAGARTARAHQKRFAVAVAEVWYINIVVCRAQDYVFGASQVIGPFETKAEATKWFEDFRADKERYEAFFKNIGDPAKTGKDYYLDYSIDTLTMDENRW